MKEEVSYRDPEETDISEHTDGFYLYSQELIEKEERRQEEELRQEEARALEELKLQSTQSTEMSFASAVSLLYTHLDLHYLCYGSGPS